MLTLPKRLALGALPGLLFLLVWLVLKDAQITSGCTIPRSVAYRTPIAAALDGTWRHLHAPVPHQMALNILPDFKLDSKALNVDAARWHSELALFRDTAWFAHDMISANSFRKWHRVYDVRTLTASEWKAYWTLVTSGFTATGQDSEHLRQLKGVVYRVAEEFSRSWPGHDDFYFEVRETRHGYVVCQLLGVGTE